jgi:hypothetical protein
MHYDGSPCGIEKHNLCDPRMKLDPDPSVSEPPQAESCRPLVLKELHLLASATIIEPAFW